MTKIKEKLMMVLIPLVFTIFHIYACSIKPLVEDIKWEIKYSYNYLKYLGRPLKFRIWFEKEMKKQNDEMIKYCDRLLEIFNEKPDMSKIRNIKEFN